MIDCRFIPLKWQGEPTPENRRRPPSVFRADYNSTLSLLETEIEKLRGTAVNIAAGFTHRDIRNDGWPYADRKPSTPGVIVSFQSQHGPLALRCDLFRDWTHNLRAIALHLEHLRLASLYGVGAGGEQYRGWKQIEAPAQEKSEAEKLTAAAEVLGFYVPWGNVIEDGDTAKEAFKIASRVTHPDRSGDLTKFNEVNQAWSVLKKHHGTQ